MSGEARIPTAPREVLASELLQEGVIASRAATSPFAGPASCGLGEGPELLFDWTDKARTLLDQLWPTGLTSGSVLRLRTAVDGWVERQDGLDRKRNHFMKDFRGEHGFERRRYTPEQLSAWEAGLLSIYQEIDAKRLQAARDLLADLG